MIIGKPLTASVSGDLKPKIIVIAPSGSTVSLDGAEGTEVSGVWTFDDVNLGNHTVTAINDGITRTKTVNVDKIGIFNVSIAFAVTIELTGSFSSSYGYVTIDGIKYSAAGSHTVPIGSQVYITVSSGSYSKRSYCIVSKNGIVLQHGYGTYAYTTDEDCTINFAENGSYLSGYYYSSAIKT